MMSFPDIPTEIKLLIVKNYLRLVLAEIETPKPRGAHSVPYPIIAAIDQILDVATALPFLRNEIVDVCGALRADYWWKGAYWGVSKVWDVFYVVVTELEAGRTSRNWVKYPTNGCFSWEFYK